MLKCLECAGKAQADCNADVDIIQDFWIADVESYIADNEINSCYIADNQSYS